MQKSVVLQKPVEENFKKEGEFESVSAKESSIYYSKPRCEEEGIQLGTEGI